MTQIRRLILYSVVFVWGLTGCMTPVAIKDVSTKHMNNLHALDQSIQTYRMKLSGYYDDLIALQRKAYIAEKVRGAVTEIAAVQSESLKRLSDGASMDFLVAGEHMTQSFDLWGRNFDLWVNNAKGTSVRKKRQWFLQKAQDLSGRARQIYEKQAARSDDDLTYVLVAIDLEQQKKTLIQQLHVLAVQMKSMQAFHAKIDEYLSIDATIDAEKIGQAAAAGSRVDVSGLTEAF